MLIEITGLLQSAKSVEQRAKTKRRAVPRLVPHLESMLLSAVRSKQLSRSSLVPHSYPTTSRYTRACTRTHTHTNTLTHAQTYLQDATQLARLRSYSGGRDTSLPARSAQAAATGAELNLVRELTNTLLAYNNI